VLIAVVYLFVFAKIKLQADTGRTLRFSFPRFAILFNIPLALFNAYPPTP
jgi:hypothetical protein